jgi:DNA-binding protein WhiA
LKIEDRRLVIGDGMSFSSDIKKEIAAVSGADRHCRIAEMAAILNTCCKIKVADSQMSLTIQTENKYIYEKAIGILSGDFKYAIPAESLNKTVSGKKTTIYSIAVDDAKIAEKLLWATGILDRETSELRFKIDTMVTKSSCCKRAYIRCAFLTSGSVSAPEKAYHLEFVFVDSGYAEDFSCLINHFGLNSKVVGRKDSFVVYLKEGEQIVDILNIMSAHNSLLYLENLRVTKEIMNNINRKVNFQSANLNKTILASVKQVEDIEYIQKTRGLTFLSPQLEELARLRLQYPEITLKELGNSLTLPLGKSGVNHRLRKISQIADELRSDETSIL